MDTTKTGNAPQPPQIGSQPINLWITKLSFRISDPDLLHNQFTAYLSNDNQTICAKLPNPKVYQYWKMVIHRKSGLVLSKVLLWYNMSA